MGRICGMWTLRNGKTECVQFRQGAVNKAKTKSANDIQIDLIQREIDIIKKIKDLPIDDQEEALAVLEEIEILRGNKEILRERRKEDSEDEDDLDSDELLRKRRLENDDDDENDIDNAKLRAELQSMQDSKYSVLSYHVGAIESGDGFLKKLQGNYKESIAGDSFLEALGAR